ncbi:MAG: TIGR03960 family B12-binding radical SAM protein [Candidatus Hydrogenedentes bacterium]|nr:TIGR03960 family B12-binding radical SAM protein [Candidatus Hydrogenedentota bacterium]
MNLRELLLAEILPTVEKPSRYLGTELHSVHKDPATVRLRVALVFPDVYELGLGNLGLHILYHILNGMDGVWAERAYTPAPDLEAALRARGLPLFLHESKDPLGAADAVGFTFQSELTYANVLNAMDLAGFAVRAADRAEDAPLFFAGGPTACNPEPMAAFMDFFVIGDGEEAVAEIANALLPLRGAPRRRRLEAVAGIPGVYVPSLHPVEMVGGVPFADAGVKVTRRVTASLEDAPYPVRGIVPFTQLVHDGVGIEVLRGCTQGCRFCQAGMINRPVRERGPETVAGLLGKSLDNTGLEESTLVSLSTCDHSRARSLVRAAMETAGARSASVSLPSLRLDTFAVELADMITGMRRSGLTFAPEAATPRLRAVINKAIPDEDLIHMAEEACRRGWEHVKTYFMIGLPTERDEDVAAIADLCLRTLRAMRRTRRDAMVRTGVSTFVPKPHSPFQFAPQISMEETIARQRMLADAFRPHRGIKFGRHNPAASFIEGLISRGGRGTADLIEAAWRNGAGYETWEERLSLEPWTRAVEETGYDAAAAFAERRPGDRLPWDHIDMLTDPKWLADEWARAKSLEHAGDCRRGRCNLCGVNRRAPELCGEMLRRSAAGRGEEELLWAAPERPGPQARPEPVQRVRFRISRTGESRLLSHLETTQVWIRALRRAGAALAYSQGFHAHPKVTFSTALPLGEESRGGDFMDALFSAPARPSELLERLGKTLPMDFTADDAWEMPLRSPALMALVAGFDYELHTRADARTLRARAGEMMSAAELPIGRTVKHRPSAGGRREIELDLRPLIHHLDVEEGLDGTVVLFSTRMRDGRLAKPREIIALLGLDAPAVRVVKTRTLLAEVGAADFT